MNLANTLKIHNNNIYKIVLLWPVKSTKSKAQTIIDHMNK